MIRFMNETRKQIVSRICKCNLNTNNRFSRGLYNKLRLKIYPIITSDKKITARKHSHKFAKIIT